MEMLRPPAPTENGASGGTSNGGGGEFI
jgi:hypothetical protein